MITLIGTGHIFNLTAVLLTVFDEKQPDIIGVELDPQRYQAILLRNTNPSSYHSAKKNLPIVYRMLAQFQESMAEQYGVNAGDEMLSAVSYAQTHRLPIAFIDTNAQQLFTHMWKTMPILEKIRLLFSGFTGLFISKKRVEEELKNYQENFETYLEQISRKFPSIKRTLIDDRNTYMAEKLSKLHQQHNRIVACVGDGHIPGISKILQEQHIPFETIRLSQLQTWKARPTDGTTASFSFTLQPK
jgi:pheromone shutdown protein TraB